MHDSFFIRDSAERQAEIARSGQGLCRIFRANSIMDGKVAVNNASKLDETHHGGQARVVPRFSRFQMVKSAARPPWRVVGG